MANAITRRDLFASLREGPYTSLGCYPKYYVSEDGATLSHAALMSRALRYGRATAGRGDEFYLPDYRIVAIGVNWEDPDMFCDETGERIPSAYAEKEG
jgi:hypothetical protein